MPEFEKTKDFPRPCDNLHQFPLKKWGPFLFAGLNPSFDFQKVIDVCENGNEEIVYSMLWSGEAYTPEMAQKAKTAKKDNQ